MLCQNINYIGETKIFIRLRFNEHLRDAKKQRSLSHSGTHILSYSLTHSLSPSFVHSPNSFFRLFMHPATHMFRCHRYLVLVPCCKYAPRNDVKSATEDSVVDRTFVYVRNNVSDV